VFDYVLLGKYPSVEDIAATRLGQSSTPIGVQRDMSAVPLPGATATPPPAAADVVAAAAASTPAASAPIAPRPRAPASDAAPAR
jgi:penicillin-binding protein 2